MMFRFENLYEKLPERFFARVRPTPVRAPRVVKVNDALARELGIDTEALTPVAAEVFSGNRVPEGASSIALAYAGHQFGSFVPQLGDGRAILMGEVRHVSGGRRDIQWKGTGRTPFSRGGDGRAALGPVLREYVVSEAMAALGVPTTRALAAVTTGEPVMRDGVLPGAVVTRVASSHLRVGTFQYFATRRDTEALEILVRHALARHDPSSVETGNDALALLEGVAARQAALVAKWLGVGFIHGVMNTDNTAISGETIDYGPCAFLDEYEPRKVFSSIDAHGRYAFMNQARIALWNLGRLAETLLPLLATTEEEAVRVAETALAKFPPMFEGLYREVLRRKIGLTHREGEETADHALANDLLERMTVGEVDYTVMFRTLADAAERPSADAEVAALFANGGAFHDWSARWRARMAKDDLDAKARATAMRGVNPAVIPRNHRIEEMIEAAVRGADFAPFERLLDAVTRPYEERADEPEVAVYRTPPKPEERVEQTFCGT